MVLKKMSDAPLEVAVNFNLDMNNEQKVNKSQKPHKSKRDLSQNTSEHTLSSPSNVTPEISNEDLNELRSIYKKCKTVIKKIETKYGHLINENNDLEQENNTTKLCTCKFNKKIIFNDDGQQTIHEMTPELHICAKKQKSNPSRSTVPNILIEREVDSLPNDLKKLYEILKDGRIDIAYRNKVIKKIKSMRMDNLNIMRFDKKFLIEELKVKPDSFFEFKGANVSSLPGYPVTPSL